MSAYRCSSGGTTVRPGIGTSSAAGASRIARQFGQVPAVDETSAEHHGHRSSRSSGAARLARWPLFLAGLAGIGGGAVIVASGSYPLQRIQTLLDPWAYSETSGFQTVQGLQALSAGGLFGTGLGNDRIVVPANVNDFIFSVIAQEMGLVGGAVVIGLFVAFAYAGVRTAIRAPDTFGGLMAAGITAWICFQALINIGVVVAVIPVTGITLPFVSAGGSSLTVSLAAVGVLLSISRETVERGWISASSDSGRGYGGTYIPGSRRSQIASD